MEQLHQTRQACLSLPCTFYRSGSILVPSVAPRPAGGTAATFAILYQTVVDNRIQIPSGQGALIR